MKSIALILQSFLFVSFSPCFSQVLWDEESQSAKMEGIIIAKDVSLKDLHERSRVWMATNITSSNEQTTSDQDSIIQLIGFGNVILSGGFNSRNRKLDFSIVLHIKDGRLKYVIHKLILIDYSATFTSPEGEPTYQDLNALYEKRFRKRQEKKDIQLLIDEKLSSLVKTLTNAVNNKN